jgi:hypothetical protein
METLNDELNKITAILQELDSQKNNYIFLPESALSTDPWDLSGRVAGTADEGTADDDLATNRQVDASGPNWLEDNDTESAVGSEGQWNTVFSQSNIIIQGSADKVMDLMTQFFGFIQNRDANEATFQVRYRYQVDCYSQVSKETNANYLYKVPGTSMIAFNFMDIARAIDYSNGNCTLMVAIDIKPIGVDSGLLYVQWGNLAVNTSEPRTLGP